MKTKLEPWQNGAIIGLIIGIILVNTNIDIITIIHAPAVVTVIVFVLIGAFIGHFKKH